MSVFARTRVVLSGALVAVFALVLAGVLAACDSGEVIDVNVPEPREVAESDYVVTDTGLKVYDFTVGDGAAADSGLVVEFHYIVWLEDGTFINSSFLSGGPSVVTLGNSGLIPGWEEGLLSMRVRGDRQLIVPPHLAYGLEGQPVLDIPPGATLIIEIALLAIGVRTG